MGLIHILTVDMIMNRYTKLMMVAHVHINITKIVVVSVASMDYAEAQSKHAGGGKTNVLGATLLLASPPSSRSWWA